MSLELDALDRLLRRFMTATWSGRTSYASTRASIRTDVCCRVLLGRYCASMMSRRSAKASPLSRSNSRTHRSYGEKNSSRRGLVTRAPSNSLTLSRPGWTPRMTATSPSYPA